MPSGEDSGRAETIFVQEEHRTILDKKQEKTFEQFLTVYE